jgi:peptidoglycan hydrolase-like protein with peptidoglycan-binding domain
MYYTDKELLELDINKKNFDTLALQIELSNRGYKLPKSTKKDGTFDGIWGDETKSALLDWQTKNKIK